MDRSVCIDLASFLGMDINMVDGFVFPNLPEWVHLIDSAYFKDSWFDRWMQIATWF
ncbi:hypothetical protein AAK899_11025 [Erysipelotrichaceae bacterium 51-3]